MSTTCTHAYYGGTVCARCGRASTPPARTQANTLLAPAPAWSPADQRDLDDLLTQGAQQPTKRLTQAQVEALVTEGAYRAALAAAEHALLRARSALAGMPEAQAVIDSLLEDV